MVVSYSKGLSKSFKNIYNRIGIQVNFRGGNAIKSLLMAPKDRDNITLKSELINKYRCNRLECAEDYLGESARNFGERLMEHFRMPSLIYDYATTSEHHTKFDNFSIVGRESRTITRTIMEAMFTRVNDPSINRTISKYHLPHIWDEVLINTPYLHLKQTLLLDQLGPLHRVHNISPTVAQ